ncbi:cation transporter [Paenibacillus sp. D2_2]|uniref:heavy-metal-associated domain-containing protein n=1 Tax=Paenibacillus sp. D2_2 TaxID=3073092 RepID=UPI002815B1CD|nr:cation transporter [Paenibacillus sp. D2_2]WMT41340.1 cation transporter [Paenibacillus sp. D2_2]
MQEVTVKVEGMNCGKCAKKVEGALEAIGAEGHVNLEEHNVNVKYDSSKLDLSDIKASIEAKGYHVVS